MCFLFWSGCKKLSQIYDLVEAERVFFADQSSNVFPMLIFWFKFSSDPGLSFIFSSFAVCVMYMASSPVQEACIGNTGVVCIPLLAFPPLGRISLVADRCLFSCRQLKCLPLLVTVCPCTTELKSKHSIVTTARWVQREAREMLSL